jgi:hypothetical protein
MEIKTSSGESLMEAMERYKREQAARPWYVRYSEAIWETLVEDPIEYADDKWHELKWAWQRVVRGYDDRYIWSYHYYNAEQTLEVLKWFKSDKTGIPCISEDASFAEPWDRSYKENEEAWNNILGKMIAGFEAVQAMEDVHVRKDDGTFDADATIAEYKRLEAIWLEGGALYIKHYRALWD